MDLRTAFEAALAVAGFMSALWIKSMRDEVRSVRDDIAELVKQVANHGERIAVLESKVYDLKGGK